MSHFLLDETLTDLHDLKAIDPIALDVHTLTSSADYFVIATGTSSRHIRALSENLIQHMKKKGVKLHVESDDEWMLIDLGDIIVHIMQAQTRELYNLEALWSHPIN